ncbi:hypothetical protein GOP47_0006558 [Adiantum capillus-veneris]|uniref:Uncharacterized protein n=1 Tax=Adiantum capillus-veneris TaxID=13818 RepID=A0A9D4V3W5_ADICA|nr:hypothetical protein GOP47_0006558 [Adiantum capillus-veneris]
MNYSCGVQSFGLGPVARKLAPMTIYPQASRILNLRIEDDCCSIQRGLNGSELLDFFSLVRPFSHFNDIMLESMLAKMENYSVHHYPQSFIDAGTLFSLCFELFPLLNG